MSAQSRFLPRHLSVVILMVESGQVQGSMQDEDLHFSSQRMAQTLRLARRSIERDRQVSSALAPMSIASLELPLHRRKRQHIGRNFLPAKLSIEFPNVVRHS